MSAQSKIDEAFSVIKDAVNEAKSEKETADLIVEAVRTGFAEAPNPNDTDRAYFDAVRERVVKVAFGYWNEHRLPMPLRLLVSKVSEAVRADKREGGWSFGIPSELTIRRRANEAASKEFAEKYEQGASMLICLGRRKDASGSLDSLYCPNPVYFQDEAKEAILKAAGIKLAGEGRSEGQSRHGPTPDPPFSPRSEP